MLKYYVKTTEAFKHLRTDENGVVSFEYIIVAACIIAVSFCCVRYRWASRWGSDCRPWRDQHGSHCRRWSGVIPRGGHRNVPPTFLFLMCLRCLRLR